MLSGEPEPCDIAVACAAAEGRAVEVYVELRVRPAPVNVASLAGVEPCAVAPPVSTTVSIWAWAYYPYPNFAMVSTDPQGNALALAYLGQSSGPPYVWTWIGTPAITGTHVYTFTADGLDAPARGLVFAGGSAVYLPIIFRQ